MSTAEQYRAKAAECEQLLGRPGSKDSEIRGLQQSYSMLADNEDWLARNADKVGSTSADDIVNDVGANDSAVVPASLVDQYEPAVLTGENQHVLRRLGAAVIMRWNTLPTKLKRELFDQAASLDNIGQDGADAGPAQAADLKGRLARFLHEQNGAKAGAAQRALKNRLRIAGRETPAGSPAA